MVIKSEAADTEYAVKAMMQLIKLNYRGCNKRQWKDWVD